MATLPISQQQNLNANLKVLANPNPADVPQPTVDLSGFTPNQFLLSPLPTGTFDVSSVNAGINELNTLVNEAVAAFKVAGVNALKIDEYIDSITHALAPVDALLKTVNLQGWTGQQFNTFRDNTLLAIAAAKIELVSIKSDVPLWNTDIQATLTLLQQLFNVSDFTDYRLSTNEVYALISTRTIYTRFIDEINQFLSNPQVPTWADLQTFVGTLSITPQEHDSIIAEIIDMRLAEFDATMTLINPIRNAKMAMSEYKQLIINNTDATSKILTITDPLLDKFSMLYTNFGPMSEIKAILKQVSGTKWDSSLFTTQVKVLSETIDPTTPNLRNVELEIKVTSVADPLKSSSHTLIVKVDDTTRIRMAFEEISNVLDDLDVTYDQTASNYNPTDTVINFIDFPTMTNDERFDAEQTLLTELQVIFGKYQDVNFANWRFELDATNNKWYLKFLLTDNNPAQQANPDPSMEFRVELKLKTPNSVLTKAINDNIAKLDLNVYQSEVDQLDELKDRLINQDFINAIQAVMPTWDPSDDSNSEIVKVGNVYKLVFKLPGGSELSFPLTIFRDAVSPSADAANDVTTSTDSSYLARPITGSTGQHVVYNENDIIDEQTLQRIFPGIFVDLVGKYNAFSLRATSDGVVRNINGKLVIQINFTDYSTPGNSVTINVEVNPPIANQQFIDNIISDIDKAISGAQFAINFTNFDTEQERFDANAILNKVRQTYESFKPTLEKMVGLPENSASEIQNLIMSEMARAQKELEADPYNVDFSITEEPKIPKNMTLISKILLLTTSSLAGIGGVAALINAGTIATTNNKLKKSDSTMRVKARKTGILSLIIAILLITISVGMFVYLFVNQGGL